MTSTELLTTLISTNVTTCRFIAKTKASLGDSRPLEAYWGATKLTLFESLSGDLQRCSDPAIAAIVATCFEHWVDWQTVFEAALQIGERSLAERPWSDGEEDDD